MTFGNARPGPSGRVNRRNEVAHVREHPPLALSLPLTWDRHAGHNGTPPFEDCRPAPTGSAQHPGWAPCERRRERYASRHAGETTLPQRIDPSASPCSGPRFVSKKRRNLVSLRSMSLRFAVARSSSPTDPSACSTRPQTTTSGVPSSWAMPVDPAASAAILSALAFAPRTRAQRFPTPLERIVALAPSSSAVRSRPEESGGRPSLRSGRPRDVPPRRARDEGGRLQRAVGGDLTDELEGVARGHLVRRSAKDEDPANESTVRSE